MDGKGRETAARKKTVAGVLRYFKSPRWRAWRVLALAGDRLRVFFHYLRPINRRRRFLESKGWPVSKVVPDLYLKMMTRYVKTILTMINEMVKKQ